MFNSIEELEKSVLDFQNNIKNSNDLMNNLRDTITALSKQNKLTDDLLHRINDMSSSLPDEIGSEVNITVSSAVTEIVTNNNDLIANLSNSISEQIKISYDAIEKINNAASSIPEESKAMVKNVLDNAVNEINCNSTNLISSCQSANQSLQKVIEKSHTNLTTTIEKQISITSETQDKLICIENTLPDTIKSSVKSVVDNAVSETKKSNSEIITILNNVSSDYQKSNNDLIEKARKYSEESYSKCSEIISSLERLPMESLLKIISENEEKQNKRFVIMIICIAVAIVLGIIGLFL